MPLDGRADFGRLHVQFAVLQVEISGDQRFDLVEQPRIMRERAKGFVLIIGIEDAARDATAVNSARAQVQGPC